MNIGSCMATQNSTLSIIPKTITAKMMYVHALYSDLNSLAHGTFHQQSVALFLLFQIKDYWFISLYEMNTLRR